MTHTPLTEEEIQLIEARVAEATPPWVVVDLLDISRLVADWRAMKKELDLQRRVFSQTETSEEFRKWLDIRLGDLDGI